MPRLEDLTPGAQVTGVLPGGPVTVVSTKWHGTNVVELTYKEADGRPGVTLLYRDSEPALAVLQPGRQWSFTADGGLFRLVSEALRIKLAYLFDPLLAVNTSDIEPLTHQITAVYEAMLPRQPLRFLLADDPGAGKTAFLQTIARAAGEMHQPDKLQFGAVTSHPDEWSGLENVAAVSYSMS